MNKWYAVLYQTLVKSMSERPLRIQLFLIGTVPVDIDSDAGWSGKKVAEIELSRATPLDYRDVRNSQM